MAATFSFGDRQGTNAQESPRSRKQQRPALPARGVTVAAVACGLVLGIGGLTQSSPLLPQDEPGVLPLGQSALSHQALSVPTDVQLSFSRPRAGVMSQAAPPVPGILQLPNPWFADTAGALAGDLSAVLPYAYAGLGSEYVWGGTSRTEGWDCSGFVQWAYRQAGIHLPRTEQWVGMRRTTTPSRGDLVAQRPDGVNHWAHVGIYIGNSMMISALNPAEGTILHPVGPAGSSTFFTLDRPGSDSAAANPLVVARPPAAVVPPAKPRAAETPPRSSDASPEHAAITTSAPKQVPAPTQVPEPAPAPQDPDADDEPATKPGPENHFSEPDPSSEKGEDDSSPAPVIETPNDSEPVEDIPASPSSDEEPNEGALEDAPPSEEAPEEDSPVKEIPGEDVPSADEPLGDPAITADVPRIILETFEAALGEPQTAAELIRRALFSAGIESTGEPEDLSSLGQTVLPIDAQLGDLIYYRAQDGEVTVAVYVGDGLAIHGASSGASTMKVSAELETAHLIIRLSPGAAAAG